jgi:hypothetical protein
VSECIANLLPDGTFIVHNCSRCDSPHDSVEFYKFTKPVVIEGLSFSRWALCPEIGEPIIGRRTDDWRVEITTFGGGE